MSIGARGLIMSYAYSMNNPPIVDLREKHEVPDSTQKPGPEPLERPIALSWEADEFTKYKKDTKVWTRNVLLFFGALAILFAVMKNILGALLMIVGGFTFMLYAVKEPRRIRFGISERGVHIDKKTYPFEGLESFWIFYDPPEVKELSIQSKHLFSPFIKLPLGDQNPTLIRNTLLRFLPELEQKESAFDVIARRLRF